MTAPNDSPEVGTATRLFPKGHLKIFLGASPGVGKTFAMLQAAAERLAEGVDVVIGYVETHKRKETEEQLENLEILPRKSITYRGRNFTELDLDGILARAPQLVLIDECAHTNIPGSRHPKRYADILEILEHGISVYTTLNIQHLESLKEIVEQMTKVTVRETIPDSFIQSADEVQLIDLPPDDLLQRLADGKVYIPEQAKKAIEHFFSRSNLLTLRELALRHVVTVADEKTAQYLKQLGIKGPWPASDKVMVCVGTHFSSHNLIRTAQRIAERLQAKWIAVTVETTADDERSLQVQQQLSHTLHVAEQLGAEVVVLDGTDIAETLVQYALTNNITDMIIGQSTSAKPWQKIPLLRSFLGPRPLADQILSYHPSLTLRVIPTFESEPTPFPSKHPKGLLPIVLPYFYSLMITLGMLFASSVISKHTNITNVSTLFFLSILWVSIKFGLWPALISTIIGSLIYDYNFVEPQYSLGITNIDSWVVLFSFVFAVIIVSNLAIHSRNVFSASQSRLRQIRFYSDFANKLLGLSKKDEVLGYLCKELHRFLSLNVIAFWDNHEKFTPAFQSPKTKQYELTEVDTGAIQWALAHKSRTGKSTENFSDATYLYLPIKIGNTSLGVIGIRASKEQLTIDDLNIAQTLINHSAIAIHRLSLKENKLAVKDE